MEYERKQAAIRENLKKEALTQLARKLETPVEELEQLESRSYNDGTGHVKLTDKITIAWKKEYDEGWSGFYFYLGRIGGPSVYSLAGLGKILSERD